MAKKKKKAPVESSKSAKERNIERKKVKQRAKLRQRIMTFVGIAIVLAIAIILIVIINRPLDAPVNEEFIDRYAEMEQFTSERGYPTLGDSLNSVRVVVYTSYTCIECEDFYSNTHAQLLDLVDEGLVSYTTAPIDNQGTLPNATGAARAALCAAEQDKFWEYQDALFLWQDEYGTQAFPANRLRSGFTNLGMDAGEFDGCISDGRINSIIEGANDAAVEQAGGRFEQSVVLVNGVLIEPDAEALFTAIDDAIALMGLTGDDGDTPAPESTEEILPETTEEAQAEEATSTPEPEPTEEPTDEPTDEPTEEPTDEPTDEPTEEPTAEDNGDDS